MLNVKIHDPSTADFDEYDVDYVSFVTPETYGPPALIAPEPHGRTRATVGEKVLYINTRLVPVVEIERTSD